VVTPYPTGMLCYILWLHRIRLECCVTFRGYTVSDWNVMLHFVFTPIRLKFYVTFRVYTYPTGMLWYISWLHRILLECCVTFPSSVIGFVGKIKTCANCRMPKNMIKTLRAPCTLQAIAFH
jgi:hypothetical protein